MPTDPDRYVDVDFTKQPEYVFGDLGGNCFSAAPIYEDSVQILPWTDIDAAIDVIAETKTGGDQLVTRIYNQRQEGSCVANATGQAAEVIQAKQFGPDNVTHLSAISLYKRIGRSAQSGSTVNDAMDEMLKVGILPLDTPENRAKFGDKVMPNTGFSTPFPSDWQSTAGMFRVVEAYAVRSVQGLFTALARREPVVVGRDGHSICYLTPTRSGGNRSVVYANSWGEWGHAGGTFDRGFGTDTQRQISSSASWAFVTRTMRVVG